MQKNVQNITGRSSKKNGKCKRMRDVGNSTKHIRTWNKHTTYHCGNEEEHPYNDTNEDGIINRNTRSGAWISKGDLIIMFNGGGNVR